MKTILKIAMLALWGCLSCLWGCKDKPGTYLTTQSVCWVNESKEKSCVDLDKDGFAVLTGGDGIDQLMGRQFAELGDAGQSREFRNTLAGLANQGLAVEIDPREWGFEWKNGMLTWMDQARKTEGDRISMADRRGLIVTKGSSSMSLMVASYGAGGCNRWVDIGEFLDGYRDTVCGENTTCTMGLSLDSSKFRLEDIAMPAAGGGSVILVVDPTIFDPEGNSTRYILGKADPAFLEWLKNKAKNRYVSDVGGGFLPMRQIAPNQQNTAGKQGIGELWETKCSFRNSERRLWGCGKYFYVTDPENRDKIYCTIDKNDCMVRLERSTTETRILTWTDCAKF